MKKGNKVPDSDEFARKTTEDMDREGSETLGSLSDRQTSNKSGKHSSVEKQAASRPEFGGRAKQLAGAHGKPDGIPANRNPVSMNRKEPAGG